MRMKYFSVSGLQFLIHRFSIVAKVQEQKRAMCCSPLPHYLGRVWQMLAQHLLATFLIRQVVALKGYLVLVPFDQKDVQIRGIND